MKRPVCRNLVVVLGDQLDAALAAFDGLDPARDVIWMAEVAGESTKVWSSQPRIAVFLAAMRHFRDELRARGWRVWYRTLENDGAAWASGASETIPSPGQDETLGAQLAGSIPHLRPERVIMVEPGEWSVREALKETCAAAGVPLELRADRHFLCSADEFARHAAGRKQLRLEFFYRELRQRHGVLMDGDQPAGGQWNFDHDNRESFGKEGPGFVPAPRRFAQDAITHEVLNLVRTRFARHPGSVAQFDWPVSAAEARLALEDFVAHRLADFGRWQDVMWSGEPWLYHSRLSAALNLKLLSPREVIAAAEQAWRAGAVPLASAEGFIRQILGWREYVRGIYWRFMPGYLDRNALGADQPLPRFYWTADTELNCLRHTLRQTLDHGYAHHIQRLMVTGLFALLLGVRPREVHEWYLAVYVDALEWVELPNTLGMSQFADGGVMASKPYVASGKYIQRMSNYCAGCRYDPAQSTGPKACPFTTLYWDFLARHEALLARNPRMVMQVRNLKRLSPAERAAIARQAEDVRTKCAA
jgi:deoxyribodipyrimidine photolyase-related protein